MRLTVTYPATGFDVMFVIAPKRHDYYLVLACSNHESIFKTDVYSITGSQYVKTPLDLGEIVLTQ